MDEEGGGECDLPDISQYIYLQEEDQQGTYDGGLPKTTTTAAPPLESMKAHNLQLCYPPVQRRLTYPEDEDDGQEEESIGQLQRLRPAKRKLQQQQGDEERDLSTETPSKRTRVIGYSEAEEDEDDDNESLGGRDPSSSAPDDLADNADRVSLGIQAQGVLLPPFRLETLTLHEFSEDMKQSCRANVKGSRDPSCPYVAEFCNWPKFMICISTAKWDDAIRRLESPPVDSETQRALHSRMLMTEIFRGIPKVPLDRRALPLDNYVMFPYVVNPDSGDPSGIPTKAEIHRREKEALKRLQNTALPMHERFLARPRFMRHRAIRVDLLPVLATACAAVPGVLVQLHPLFLFQDLQKRFTERAEEARRTNRLDLAAAWRAHLECLELTKPMLAYMHMGPPQRVFADPNEARFVDGESRTDALEKRMTVVDNELAWLRDVVTGQSAPRRHRSAAMLARVAQQKLQLQPITAYVNNNKKKDDSSNNNNNKETVPVLPPLQRVPTPVRYPKPIGYPRVRHELSSASGDDE